ncbi:peptide chain release factor N(5)-glutamine methyltransferase [[Acholeplasma] multilocale]|uniref:peptide chain release factor N(5)-glutamine methyltransferase n=1 Tax=[Acholeplasma] multilocale TaxID=264638 RepID=UPI00047A239D|nr:peptide chain release factor N(5)-glutamine methyltransferase [[Acholeplasma] multilocale]
MANSVLETFNKLNKLNISLQKADVYQILSTVLNLDYDDVVMNMDMLINPDQETDIEDIVRELEEGVPLAYILTSKTFYGIDLYVDHRVLIPRSDTEIAVDLANDFLKKYPNAEVTDICTGSGAIAIAVAKHFPNTKIKAIDISEEALEVAQINIKNNEIKNIELIQGDFLNPLLDFDNKVNLVITNPPYIEEDDTNVGQSVNEFEPHLALYAEDRGLKFYKILFDKLERIVDTSKPFAVIAEFGFEQKDEIEEIINSKSYKYNTKYIKDNSNNWRCVIITNE